MVYTNQILNIKVFESIVVFSLIMLLWYKIKWLFLKNICEEKGGTRVRFKKLI